MCLIRSKRSKADSKGGLPLLNPDKKPEPGGMKRLRDESSGDMGLSPKTDKKLALDADAAPKEWRPRLKRSNSVDQLGKPLSIADRKTASTALKKADMKDFAVVAVYSREAFENFGKKWKLKMEPDTLDLATPDSKNGVTDIEVRQMLGRQSKTLLGTDFQAQPRALLENKASPHVIAVIEGKQELPSFSIKAKAGDKVVDVVYTRTDYFQGENALGHKDNKQSMSFYVREDMRDVYNISKEKVMHGDEEITTAGVNFKTENGIKYRTLVVHIPNEFLGNKTMEDETHSKFQKYAADKRVQEKVVVTSYLGDTNFKSPMSTYSSPSMGGHLSSGGTLNPRSSSAKKPTHFMQDVPLSAGEKGHSLLQPSTLNYVFISPDADNREATDHPSIMQYVALDSELKGRSASGPLRFLDFE
ncbi:hypothetical protein [Mucilaginibacter sp. BT774]|uniref:hypothetical protein n=1 Tax=Mucilaginibacter sp. BT774 TaxID=3062276 RepID=UPI00267686EF|nr:hypothetical protein [Mucilaginibacter sp. BT774]MDO3628613.1 hypothetical protein [Mucilaginibacter sp. BT774]